MAIHILILHLQNFDESISSIQGGHVSSCDYPEIIIATYTGRIFSLTTQCINSSISNENLASSTRMVNEATSSVSSQTSVDNQRIIRLRYDNTIYWCFIRNYLDFLFEGRILRNWSKLLPKNVINISSQPKIFRTMFLLYR